MSTFIAHYSSASQSASSAKGFFDFESTARLGSKANRHDARVRMLELYGNEALSWTIDSIDHKRQRSAAATMDGQLELDFREHKAPSKHRRTTKRGVL